MLAQDARTNETSLQTATRSTRFAGVQRLLTSWELYPILLITIFLHFYRIDTGAFKYDEAEVFRFAREAVTNGFIPLTSNPSSIGSINYPLMTYLGMIPAALSANPAVAQAFIALCNTLAVLFTYLFVRRYYGRLAGSIAALLYTTAVLPLIFSRFFWPQNLLPFFTMLFMMCVFRGVVERRRGWFAPALLSAVMAYQLHGTGLFLLGTLALAVFFAWRTLRIRDFLWGGIGLALLFAPFIYWEFKVHFFDILQIIRTAKAPAKTTGPAPLAWYRLFLTPYDHDALAQTPALPSDPRSVFLSTPLHFLTPLLKMDYKVMPYLLLFAIVSGALRVLWPLRTPPATRGPRFLRGILGWWLALWHNPQRQGLILLLSWQAISFVMLSRQSVTLHAHYFIIFIPGQFILIALFLADLAKLVRNYQPRWTVFARYGVGAVAFALILAQFVGSSTFLFDAAHGYFTTSPSGPFYSEVNTLQKVTSAADKLAQEQHIKRIYISTSYELSQAMDYYAGLLQTPTSVFEYEKGCFVLPDPAAGPVVFLSQSYGPLDDSFIARYAQVSLVQTSPRLSGPPFKLYVLTTKPTSELPKQSFNSGLQSLSTHADVVTSVTDQRQWLTTRWRVMDAENRELRTVHHFSFAYQGTGSSSWSGEALCSTSSFWAGDQVFGFVSKQSQLPAQIDVRASSYKEAPISFRGWFNLWLLSYRTQESERQELRTNDGKKTITLPVIGRI
jgi:4-amino-4-deoxy-L-arabinose transferase-like glycosyltransferase